MISEHSTPEHSTADHATTVRSTVAPRALPRWNSAREALRSGWVLGVREIRTSLRTPAYVIPNMIVPIFFFFVMVGSLGEFASGFGIENFKAFQLPVSIIFAVQGGSAGLNMVADIESGYLDKLLATPASRLSILLGAMTADLVRVMVQATLVLIVAFIVGVDFATGIPGAVVLILLSGLFGLGFSGIGFAVALKTGNAQSTQSVWALFMPLMFLTTLFAPKEALSGWLSTVATVNPLTYVLAGMRSLSMNRWDGSDLGGAALAVTAMGTVGVSLALFAFRGRIR